MQPMNVTMANLSSLKVRQVCVEPLKSDTLLERMSFKALLGFFADDKPGLIADT